MNAFVRAIRSNKSLKITLKLFFLKRFSDFLRLEIVSRSQSVENNKTSRNVSGMPFPSLLDAVGFRKGNEIDVWVQV